jgi:hypothetical protein
MVEHGQEPHAAGVALQNTSEGDVRGTVPPEMPFDREDLQQFDQDDVSAGRAIGKMLAFFFLYTIIAMSIAAYWTWTTLGE